MNSLDVSGDATHFPQRENALELQSFERLLADGDERIAIDRATGRNRYGVPCGMAREEVWFSSSTASAISPRGYDAALKAYRSLVERPGAGTISACFDHIRTRLTRLFGTPGAEIVLSGSGTELELIALFLARSILRGPLTNVVVAPHETGRGVLLAASGRHFLGSTGFLERVTCGRLIEGFEAPDCSSEIVEIRDQHGIARTPDNIDNEIIEKVEAGMARDRCVLIHLLDCSKTNLGGFRRSTAAALMAKYAGQVLVVVDSCQLRCSPEQIRADLRAGFMVMITGSKFAGGPPFAGALLLPSQIVQQLGILDLPPGLLAYTAAEDWPAPLRSKIGRRFDFSHNLGAGLRWEAALAELEELFSLPTEFREAVASAFAAAVGQRVAENPRLALIGDEAPDELPSTRTIFPIVTGAGDTTNPTAEALHRSLRLPARDGAFGASSGIFHVGQPVAIGHRSALRVCLSAPQIVDAAENMAAKHTFEAALAPLMADIDDLFLKWAVLANDGRRCT